VHGLGGVRGGVDDDPVGLGVGSKFFQVVVQFGDEVRAHALGALAHDLQILWERSIGYLAGFQAALGVPVQSSLQLRIG
jgi:hypothetical protein